MTDATTPTPEAKAAAEALANEIQRIRLTPGMPGFSRLDAIIDRVLAFGAAREAAGREAARAVTQQCEVEYVAGELYYRVRAPVMETLSAALGPTPSGDAPAAGGTQPSAEEVNAIVDECAMTAADWGRLSPQQQVRYILAAYAARRGGAGA